MLLSLEGLDENYCISSETRAAIIWLTGDLIKENMGYSLELVEVSYPGRLPGEPHSLPLRITTVGPSNISIFALAYIVQAVRDHQREFVKRLKLLDGGDPFANIRLSVETFDFDDVVSGPTLTCTDSPNKSPTQEPETEPMPPMEEINDVDVKNTPAQVPWWMVFIIVALILLFCTVCTFCFCVYHKKGKKVKKIEQLPSRRVMLAKRVPPKGRYSHRAVKQHEHPLPIVVYASSERDGSSEENKLQLVTVPANPEANDPPGNALVLYNPNPRARDPTMYSYDPNPRAPDPTAFENRQPLQICADPSAYHEEHSAIDPPQGTALAVPVGRDPTYYEQYSVGSDHSKGKQGR